MGSTIERANRKPREASQGGTSTTETAFTSDGTLPVILHLPSAGKGGETNNARTARYKVHAFGSVTGGTTTNFTAVLYSGTSATLGSNTAIETTGAVAVNSISSNWFIEADICVDAVSNEMHGLGRTNLDDTVTAEASLTNSPTSIDIDSDTEYGFVVSWTFSAGHASNVARLDGFLLEEIY
jgi:hypothetical protein